MKIYDRQYRLVRWLQEYSLPLIAGVLVALIVANWNSDIYHALVMSPLHQIWHNVTHAGHFHVDHGHGWEHYFSLHFLVNDIFMVLFFGVAAKEITEACLPGGALNPFKRALNPLFATIGGILGPVLTFFALNAVPGEPSWKMGWGIRTATDIALAWLVARLIFGNRHPAVSFLLLLAVADDAIGLGIIAFAYPDPLHPVEWANTAWILAGLGTAFGLRFAGVRAWLPYVLFGGAFAWWGLFSAHLHPALALVFIVPLIPAATRDRGLYVAAENADGHQNEQHSSPLDKFEHSTRSTVDFGLFFFAFANAGVAFSDITSLTWIILTSLVIGKLWGITAFAMIAEKLGFAMPTGMKLPHLAVTSVIAGLGLTVALFVSGQAFVDVSTQSAAKMGALMSAAAALAAVVLANVLGVAEGTADLSRLRIPLPIRRPSRVGQ